MRLGGLPTLAAVSNCLLAAGTFEETVLPILKSNCTPCHDQATKTSGFSIATAESVLGGGSRRGPAVIAGSAESSPLAQVLRGTLKPQMPPGKTLAPREIAVIDEWIRTARPGSRPDGARTHWSLARQIRPPAQDVKTSAWARSPLDNFVLAKLEPRGLLPAPEASRSTLVRRLYFDLIGVPPSPEEILQFVEDNSPRAYGDLVDRLLSSPHYGERWGRYWLDLARYADTNGYEGDAEFYNAWRYRDYVVDAFNADKPYDEFLIDQLAGDEYKPVTGAGGLPAPDPEKVVALTFLRLAPFTEPRGEESRDVLLSEMVSTVSSVYLGWTVGCAKCHDHKYDPIPTRDFYRLKAFFASTYIAPPRPGDTQQLGGPQPAAFHRPGEAENIEIQAARFRKELEAVGAEFDSFAKPLVARLAAIWKRDKPSDTKTPSVRDVERIFNEENNNTVGVVKKDETFTAAERDRFRSFRESQRRLKNSLLRLEPVAMSVRNADDPPYGPSVPVTHVLLRGDHDRPGEIVQAGFPSAIAGHSDPVPLPLDRYKRHPTRGRRMTLARWIASPDNPLTARVMVNRIWQHHFGRGIVDTPSDFGRNGSRPTHPELLDWLATAFVENNWSIKAMHRLILASSTYRQSSQGNAAAQSADPDNRLYSRFPRQRLTAEAIRDSILAVSGRLNRDLGGPPVFPALPEGLDREQRVQTINTWETSPDADALRRSIYVFQRRSLSLPMLEVFDAPVPNASCDLRRNTVTALQPLTMYDSEFVNAEARHFAERVRREAGPSLDEQVRRAFLVARGRAPSDTERRRSLNFVRSVADGRDGLLGVCRVLLNSSEFLYVD